MRKLSAAAFIGGVLLMPMVCYGQSQQIPLVVTGTGSTGGNSYQPVGTGAGTSTPMPVSVTGGAATCAPGTQTYAGACPVMQPNTTDATGAITSNQSVTLTSANGGSCSFAYDIAGTWSGLIVVEVQVVNGGTWYPTTAIPWNSAPAGAFTANSSGQGSLSGAYAVRFRGNVVTAGTANVTLRGAAGCSTTHLDNSNQAVNVAQFGGSNVVTGTGVSGVGIPRVTVSNDSVVQVQGNVAGGAADSGNPNKIGGVYNATPPTYTTGQRVDAQATQRGYIIQAIGDATGSNVAAVSNPGDGAGVTGNLYTASRETILNGTSWDRVRSIQGSDGTGLGILATHTAPNSNANAGIIPVVSTALESCHVLKGSSGNLYNLAVTIQATTGIVQLFNATSAPVDGAVTPVWSQPIVSNGTLGGAGWTWNSVPINFSTGITVCFSSATTPFTKTASATAMFSAGVK